MITAKTTEMRVSRLQIDDLMSVQGKTVFHRITKLEPGPTNNTRHIHFESHPSVVALLDDLVLIQVGAVIKKDFCDLPVGANFVYAGTEYEKTSITHALSEYGREIYLPQLALVKPLPEIKE